jgi:predicted RNA-binding protein
MQGDSDMCEANAYLTENGTQTLIMEAVDKVEPDEDGIRLVSIFGEQKFVKGHIHSLSLVDHKVFITPA